MFPDSLVIVAVFVKGVIVADVILGIHGIMHIKVYLMLHMKIKQNVVYVLVKKMEWSYGGNNYASCEHLYDFDIDSDTEYSQQVKKIQFNVIQEHLIKLFYLLLLI